MTPKKTKKTSIVAGLNPNNQPNREVFQRLNFLNQAAHYLATVTTQIDHSMLDGEKKNDNKFSGSSDHQLQLNHKATNQSGSSTISNLPMIQLSHCLSKSMKVIAKKSVVRMDPSVKRTLCKSCQVLLISGYTAKVRVKTSGPHRHVISATCLNCHHCHNIPNPPTLPSDKSIDSSDNHILTTTSSSNSFPRQARALPFWKKSDHLTFAGSTQINGDVLPNPA